MFAAMIFDRDGVLAYTHPVHRRVWRQLLLKKDLTVPPQGCLVAADSCAGVHAAKLAAMKYLALAAGEPAVRLLSEGADELVPSLAGLSISTLQDLLEASRTPANLPGAGL
jgi:beta-phosphoglucomutase-like phosphatase (HAD superfamily)